MRIPPVKRKKNGQALTEFALVYVGLIIPITFAIVFTAQMLWLWHSINEWTREGARYAATHCWQPGGSNVLNYMRSNVPVNVDQEQLQSGQADVEVLFYARDADTGTLSEFSCDSECSPNCVPDLVTVRVNNYEFRRFMAYLGLSPVQMPNFSTTVPIEGAGCDPEANSCTP